MATRTEDQGAEAEVGWSLPPPLVVPDAVPHGALRFQLGVAYVSFVLIGAIDAALGVLLPGVRAFYGIDKSTVGFIFAASTLGYLVSAFSSGPLVVRLGRRAYMLLGCSALGTGALAFAFALPFGAILVGGAFMGFGIAVIDAGLNAYIAGLTNNTGPLNYLHAFFGIGALLGPLVASGIIALTLPWNLAYALWATTALALLFIFQAAFREPVTATRHRVSEPRQEPATNVILLTLRIRAVWMAAIFLFVYVGVEVGIGSWAYTFLTEHRGEAEELSGLIVSGYWLGLTLGRLLMGKVGTRLGNRNLVRLCLAGTLLGIGVVWALPYALAHVVGLWLVGFSLGPIFPTTIALMSGIVPPRLLPSAVGFLASFGAVGAAAFPFSAGALAEAAGLQWFLPYELALAGVLVLLWLGIEARSIVPGPETE